MSSLVIGLLLIMTGAGGFMATQSLIVLPILVPGVLLALGGRRLVTRGVSTSWLAAMLASSTVPMLFFATALPRAISVLFGSGETVPGSIFAVGMAAVLCLIHATLALRQIVRLVQRGA